jgi:dUTPase
MPKVKILVKKVEGLKLPVKANDLDAAYDVFSTSGPKIIGTEVGGGIYSEIDYIEYGTNLFVAPQTTEEEFDMRGYTYLDINDWWLQGLPRSSISKYNLILANSCPTIDCGFRGEIRIRMKYIVQPSDLVLRPYAYANETHWEVMGARVNLDKCYKVGDRVCQLRPVKNIDIDWIEVDELEETDRNEGGFGSSGGNSAK